MAYLNETQLRAMNFKSLGRNVRISDKASIYNADQIEIGNNARIDDFCVLSGKISIKRNVHIAVFCTVAGGEQGIIFEEFCGLSYGGQVFTQSDDYSGQALTGPTVPSRYKREIKKPVIIGRHSIIGASSIVLPGVVIAEGTSIGAQTLVIESTQAWSIYVGSPAKRIKARKRDLLELEKEYLSAEGII